MPRGRRCLFVPVTGTDRSVVKLQYSSQNRRKRLINRSTQFRQEGVFPQCCNRSQQKNSWVAEKRKIKSVHPSKRAGSRGRNSEVQSPQHSKHKTRVLGTGMQHLLQMWKRLFKYSWFPPGCKTGINSPPLQK